MNETEFSIIIPVFNGEKYIKECIESAVSQSFKGKYEIIVVNDGSNDSTTKILTEFKDEKLKIFNNKNSGPAFSRNFGIEKARGKHIAFLDSDDILDKDALQNFYDVWHSAYCKNGLEADIIFAPYYVIREHKNDIKLYFPLKKFIPEKNFLNISTTKGEVLKGNFEPWAKIYKRDFLIKNGIKFTEARLAEDLPFFYKAVSSTEKILLCKKPVYFYRKGHKQFLKEGKYDWDNEVINALLESDEIIKKCHDFKLIEKIYAKNCLDICLFWARKFKNLKNRGEFYAFCRKYLSKYGLHNNFTIKLFIRNLVDI